MAIEFTAVFEATIKEQEKLTPRQGEWYDTKRDWKRCKQSRSATCCGD